MVLLQRCAAQTAAGMHNQTGTSTWTNIKIFMDFNDAASDFAVSSRLAVTDIGTEPTWNPIVVRVLAGEFLVFDFSCNKVMLAQYSEVKYGHLLEILPLSIQME